MVSPEIILSDNDLEHFDELFSRSLTQEEFLHLKSALQNDSSYLDKYLLYRSLMRFIELNALDNNILTQRFNELDSLAKYAPKRKLWLSFLIAASVLVLAFVFSFFYQHNNNWSSVYKQYKNTETGLPILMDQEELNPIQKAFIKFAEEDYGVALVMFQSIPQNDTTIYYQGVCYEYMNSFDSASRYYNVTLKSPILHFAQKSDFRLALIAIHNQDSSALSSMGKIAEDSTHLYQHVATDILLSIDK
jgi:tetratricopeptide (TPR) repeat protein